jgi:hypothetical protein
MLRGQFGQRKGGMLCLSSERWLDQKYGGWVDSVNAGLVYLNFSECGDLALSVPFRDAAL